MADQPPDFDTFGYEESWAVGSALITRGRRERLPIAVGNWFGEQGFGLSRSDYAPGEGAVPIMVHGSLIGVLSVSGLKLPA